MIVGHGFNRSVTIDGRRLDPVPSQQLINHSPDGFAWGYAGSGPAQLALALLLHFSGNSEFSLAHYQDFKFDVIQGLSEDGFELANDVVTRWIRKHRGEGSYEPIPEGVRQ
jgi:hypothetical protein